MLVLGRFVKPQLHHIVADLLREEDARRASRVVATVLAHGPRCALTGGLAFLLPIFLIFLQLVGVLSSRRLAGWRRYSILVIAIFAAVITPSGDPYTMLAMMIPMYLFYEASIIIGRALKR